VLVTLLVGLGLASSTLASSRAPHSMRWESNVWQTPTGSIMCRYFPQATIITCTSQRSGLSVKLGQDGPVIDIGPARRAGRWSVHHVPGRYEPMVVYGAPWKSDEFRCVAQTTGVTCRVVPGLRQLMGDHGFFLNRRHARRW
jgi:hypothetical protein